MRIEINFTVGDEDATFSRSSFSGRTTLRVGSQSFLLASPYRLSTHYELRTRREWSVVVNGHSVRVVKTRPRWVGGMRSNSFEVFVDDQPAAVAAGM